MSNSLINSCYLGDCMEGLARFISSTDQARTCITSPPYWGLRDYGHAEAHGLEESLDEYIDRIVAVFQLVRECLTDDGTLWLNLGDTYRPSGNGGTKKGFNKRYFGKELASDKQGDDRGHVDRSRLKCGLKPKDLVGIPWRVAFALQADGWYLRQDIIWHKPNPMPESVTDRCTKSHEYLFLLSKSARYYYDADAISEPASDNTNARAAVWKTPDGWDTSTGEGAHGNFHKKGREKGAKGYKHKTKRDLGDAEKIRPRQNSSFSDAVMHKVERRNRRSVWTIGPERFAGAHFATFPPALIEPCIVAGSEPGDIVLDPYMGSGTTAQVAEHLNRRWFGCEINPDYHAMQAKRLAQRALPLV